MGALAELDHAAATYDRLAPYYDAFTAAYAYERWIAAIERRAVELGLVGGRALDLACGTGKSTAPLITRGYSMLACDISEGMLREARRKFPTLADRFVVADMRELPSLGEFDFVLCLDDAINYLLSEDELEATFTGVAQVLARDGVFAFDLNSLLTYRTAFAEMMVRENDGLIFIWRGAAQPTFEPGEVATAEVEILADRRGGPRGRSSIRHVQRHHPPEVVRAALESAGLECRAIAGQHPGARLEDTADDERHIKLVYFAQLATTDD